MLLRLALRALTALLAVGASHAQDLFDLTQVRTLRLTFQDPNYWSTMQANYGTPTYLRASLEVDGVVYSDVGVQMRGRAAFSCAGTKKPLKIKMDQFVPGQELYGYDSLRLNNGIGDPTFVREVVLGELTQPYVAEPRRTWAAVVTNGVSRGLYILEEQKDGAFMRANFGSDEGHRYYPDAPAALTYLGPGIPAYTTPYDHRTPEHQNPWFTLITCAHRLATLPLASLPTEYDEVFAVDSALWAFAVSSVFGNWDSYIGNSNNWYFVEEGANGRGVMLQHDMNLAFGTWDVSGPTTDIYFGSSVSDRPLANRLLAVNKLRRRYEAFVRNLRDEAFDWARMQPMVDAFQTMIDPFVQVEPSPMYPYSTFRGNLSQGTGGPCWTVPALRTFVQQRRNYLNGLAVLNRPTVALSQLHVWPNRPRPGEPIAVTVRTTGGATPSEVLLRARTFGRFLDQPMFDDGAHGDGGAGDGIFGALLPPNVEGAVIEYYVEATAAAPSEAISFLPTPGPGNPRRLRIANDVRGIKVTEYAYEGGSGEFIELTNTDVVPIDLAGWSLDDQSGDPGVVPLDDAGVLAPGQSLIVSEAVPALFRSRWNLPASAPVVGPNALAPLGRADVIHVFDAAGQLRDSLEYGDERFPGTPRTRDVSATVCSEGLGANDPYAWRLSAVGDAQGSRTSAQGDIGSPGQWTPETCQPGGIGSVYCVSTANSSGGPSTLEAYGSRWAGDDDVTLAVEGLPTNALGFFLASRVVAHVPGVGGGPGVLCLGNPIQRFQRDIFSAGTLGRVQYRPALTSLPVLPGETWHFQFWHRDFTSVPSSNLSAAIAIPFE